MNSKRLFSSVLTAGVLIAVVSLLAYPLSVMAQESRLNKGFPKDFAPGKYNPDTKSAIVGVEPGAESRLLKGFPGDYEPGKYTITGAVQEKMGKKMRHPWEPESRLNKGFPTDYGRGL